MDQRVSGDVKTQRKKSEKARVTMKELRGSALSWGQTHTTSERGFIAGREKKVASIPYLYGQGPGEMFQNQAYLWKSYVCDPFAVERMRARMMRLKKPPASTMGR